MNKNINNIVELTEKELACVCGGGVPPALEKLLEGLLHPLVPTTIVFEDHGKGLR